ncbi:prephenate dehydrogenase [Chengkuizengella axinellae]|uniref:Prephenate dehydrogenase n=1 Tax=Chengkuizengella axinellae TaxID=3064388 RepID=A0ABT9IWU8_9BACL|nr:prephenate dehydrogenase [Chengkuizengella sp. 2205SS18-9]MDP5273815.1 prephenate dehydrogenase [Chengkuizengella sp. 2205SS18-9]
MKITIFGVGLIGGSLALCFKDKPNIRVVGHSNNPKSVQKYVDRKVVDEATTSIEEAALDADFIFLCVPVGLLEEYLLKLSKLPLKSDCIITDVGSTKESITSCAKSISLKNGYFIGGHPMAGSERSGVDAATSYLFENAFYVLTPDPEIPEHIYKRLEDLLAYTKSQIIKVDASTHDDIVGAISHLPHIIAVSLVNQVAKYNDQNDLYERLAAGGFKDLTRIASGDPVIWRDILLNNKKILLHLLEDWQLEISKFIELLKSDDGQGVEDQFKFASDFRSKLPERRKGVMTSLFDVYVDIKDHPGVIGHITSELGNRKISLKNIEIIESRAEVPGILRLSFRSENDLENAVELLKELSYSVHF